MLFCILLSISWLKMLYSVPIKHSADALPPTLEYQQRQDHEQDQYITKAPAASLDEHFHCLKTVSEKLYGHPILVKNPSSGKGVILNQGPA